MGSDPVFHVTRVTKTYGGLRPLRVADLVIAPGERVAISGLDVGAAEVFVDLLTGATLPDEGDIRVFGRATAEIATDTEWLASLDRFGLVTNRAVLLDGLSVRQNLAVPFTLSIEPVEPEIAARVATLATEVRIERELLERPVAAVPPDARIRIHLARAIALEPAALLMEHPTVSLPQTSVAAFASDVRRVADARRLAVLALTEDLEFATMVADRVLTLKGATGVLSPASRWTRWIGR
jgi:ABC-type transporter Mla maintaining outer membrane lipid asymmetry ATPase subunit MlaF